jgi:hypothetical protein
LVFNNITHWHPTHLPRYNILAAAAVARAKNDKSAAKVLFDTVGLEVEKYRLGYTKASAARKNKNIFFSIW